MVGFRGTGLWIELDGDWCRSHSLDTPQRHLERPNSAIRQHYSPLLRHCGTDVHQRETDTGGYQTAPKCNLDAPSTIASSSLLSQQKDVQQLHRLLKPRLGQWACAESKGRVSDIASIPRIFANHRYCFSCTMTCPSTPALERAFAMSHGVVLENSVQLVQGERLSFLLNCSRQRAFMQSPRDSAYGQALLGIQSCALLARCQE